MGGLPTNVKTLVVNNKVNIAFVVKSNLRKFIWTTCINSQDKAIEIESGISESMGLYTTFRILFCMFIIRRYSLEWPSQGQRVNKVTYENTVMITSRNQSKCRFIF